eukprot:6209915-Pleurochrysis_carterae.AAC.1
MFRQCFLEAHSDHVGRANLGRTHSTVRAAFTPNFPLFSPCSQHFCRVRPPAGPTEAGPDCCGKRYFHGLQAGAPPACAARTQPGGERMRMGRDWAMPQCRIESKLRIEDGINFMLNSKSRCLSSK